MTFSELEKARENYNKKHDKIAKKAYFISIPIAVPLGLFILITTLSHKDSTFTSFMFILPPLLVLAIFTFAIPAAIIAFSTRKELSEYKRSYKSYFIAQSFQKVFTNINYNHNSAMPESIVDDVMYTYDHYSSNDLMSATYKGINFTQADVHTEERRESTDSDGHKTTYYVTIFRGRFLIFDFNRNFNFNLQVSSKNFPGERLPVDPNKKLKFERIKTESGDFNRDFHIYGQDGVETFYILDPAFIEKIQNLYNDLGYDFSLTFMNNKLYIALNNGEDSFEAPSPRKPIDEKTELEKVGKDIHVITNFVDSLDLDRYTIKKEK